MLGSPFCITVRHTIYSYKQNPASVESVTVDETTGKESKRLVNRHRWKGWAPISITYSEIIPLHPPQSAQKEALNTNRDIMAKLRQVCEHLLECRSWPV